MTRVYFVRHAQPEHDWEEDRTRPLTEEGKKDSVVVLEFLSNKKKMRFIVVHINVVWILLQRQQIFLQKRL